MAVSLSALFLLFFVLGCQAIEDGCIRCLCEAISGGPICNYDVVCHSGVCGPYAITWPYWVDAGRPTVGLDDRTQQSTYEKCTTDVSCSEATIRGYMDKFHQDCNQDGQEDCFDYAAVHFHGGYGCNKPLAEPARNALVNCLQRLDSPPPPPLPPLSPDGENDIARPQEPTTFPSIDIRFGDSK